MAVIGLADGAYFSARWVRFLAYGQALKWGSILVNNIRSMACNTYKPYGKYRGLCQNI